jgi:putative sigma-54 modulation protein
MHVPTTFYPAAEKKLSKFDRFFPDDTEVVLKLSSKRNLDSVEMTINSDGIIYRSEKQADSLLSALDEAIEATLRQIRKNKTRLEKKLRGGAFTVAQDEPEIGEEEDKEPIARVKTFSLKPMSAEEAVMQMNLLGHSFFVFTDQESGKVCVVYRRDDKNYGMIIQE